LRAGFGIGRAAGEGGEIFKTVFFNKIAEWKSVAENNGMPYRAVNNSNESLMQFGNPLYISRRVLLVKLGVFRVGIA
jgi:hypothetical protein